MTCLSSLPTEILDEVVRYLDSKSMVRFCRAIPQLNEYADTLVNVGTSLKVPLSSLWPRLIIYRNPTDLIFIEKNEKLITRLGTLVSRFNGLTTFIGTFDGENIARVCAMASTTIDIYVNFLVDKDEVCLWAEQVRLQNKRVNHLILDRADRSNLGPAIISQAIVDCNPRKLSCGSTEVVLADLVNCSRLRSLQLDYKLGLTEGLMLSSILVQLVELRELDLKCMDSKIVLDVVKAFPKMKIRKARFEINADGEYSWDDEKDPIYLGEDEVELARLLREAQFVFKGKNRFRSLLVDDKEDREWENGYWYFQPK
ncbi:hypothetical protein HDU79_004619 [Rhizoclosmatium sp. JEL0117]|nr:hypothetical protein HDU79_004619 [Rhizoclosmatium sp. JEL0117]